MEDDVHVGTNWTLAKCQFYSFHIYHSLFTMGSMFKQMQDLCARCVLPGQDGKDTGRFAYTNICLGKHLVTFLSSYSICLP